MYCTNCGKEIEDKSTFCSFCGNKIEYQINKQSKCKGKKHIAGIGLFTLLVVATFLVFGKGNIKNTENISTNIQIVARDEKNEVRNSIENEASQIKEEGLTQEIRNYLLQKSDEYGQTRSNYANLSVEPVIVEGYLEKKDKSKDATMEEDDPEYYYINLEKAMNITYESYLNEDVLEESMDTIKLDATNLDSLCGKKVYCCGKVIDSGVASSGIHMMTAVVIDADNRKLVSNDINSNVGNDSKFVPDCSKENYNKVGNTFTNLLNGGQVASQGEWMYYVRSNGGWGSSAWGPQEICKEPIEGGTPVVVYTAIDEDIDIEYLNVVGDYIYFKEKTIKRIRCDGKEYKDYEIESKYHFCVFDSQIVYTNEIHESTEHSWWTLMLYDTMIGEEMDLYESVDPDFWGMEELQDTVIFYMGQSVMSMNQYVVSYYEIEKDLSDGFEDGYLTFNGSGETMELAYRFWHKKMLSGKEVFDIQSNQELCHKDFNKTNQISFSNRYLIMNFIDNYIVGYGTHPGTFKGLMYCTLEEYLNNEYHVINGDEPGVILCAGQWVYYTCNNGVHRVKLDGSGYQVVKRNVN